MNRKQFSKKKTGCAVFKVTNTSLDLGIIRGYIYDYKYIFNQEKRLSAAITLSPLLTEIIADVILEVTDLYIEKVVLDMLYSSDSIIGCEFKIYCDLNIYIWSLEDNLSIKKSGG